MAVGRQMHLAHAFNQFSQNTKHGWGWISVPNSHQASQSISMPRDGVRSGSLLVGQGSLSNNLTCSRSHRVMAAREDGTLGRYHRACFAERDVNWLRRYSGEVLLLA